MMNVCEFYYCVQLNQINDIIILGSETSIQPNEVR